MTQPERVGRPAVEASMRRALERAGVGDALDQALAAAHLDELPSGPEAIAAFVAVELFEALTGRVHPVTARMLVDEILEQVAPNDTGARPRHGGIETVPPPAADSVDPYQDLVSGAVHTRATPVWGVRRNEIGGIAHLWLLISNHPQLLAQAQRAAPAGTDVVLVSSMGLLLHALTRDDCALNSVVLDADDPSIPFHRAVAVLSENPGRARVILWRLSDAKSAQLSAAVPVARSWLSFEDELTPIEIVHLLGA